MILKISIDQANSNYLESVGGGIQGMSRYINHLISNDRKEHDDNDDNDDLDQMLRLHRHQQGFAFPTMIQPRGKSGSVRRPWRSTIRRGSDE